MSIPILGEKATSARSLAVFLSVIGVLIACLFSPSSTRVPVTLSGLVIALGGEFLKAFYNVWFKVAFGDPGAKFLFFMLSVVAVLHFIVVLPVIMLAHFANWERLEFNVREGFFLLQVGFAAFCASMVNLGSLLVIAWSSPTVWSIMSTLIIPFSVLLDAIFCEIRPTLNSSVGLGLILAALLVFHQEDDDKQKYEEIELTVKAHEEANEIGCKVTRRRSMEEDSFEEI